MYKTITIKTIVATALLYLGALQANGQWSAIKNFPGGQTDGVAAFTINNKVYLAGGLGKKTLYEFDPATGNWSSKTDVGGGVPARAWSGAFVINGKGYVFGGSYSSASDVTADMQVYDATANSWTPRAAFGGGGRDAMYTFALGSNGYAGGGFDGANIVGDFWKYESDKDKWTQMKNPPFGPVIFASAFVVNGKAFVMGGSPGSGELKTLYEYNAADDSWTKRADFTGAARQAGFTFSSATDGFYGGGMSNYTTIFTDVWKYNPMADKWMKEQDIPHTFAAWSTAAVANNKAYVGTGASFAGGLTFSDSVFAYQLPVSVTGVNMEMKQAYVYPNPVKNLLYVESRQEIQEIIVCNTKGEIVSAIWQDNKIDVSKYAPGMYFLRLVTKDVVSEQRFIKE